MILKTSLSPSDSWLLYPRRLPGQLSFWRHSSPRSAWHYWFLCIIVNFGEPSRFGFLEKVGILSQPADPHISSRGWENIIFLQGFFFTENCVHFSYFHGSNGLIYWWYNSPPLNKCVFHHIYVQFRGRFCFGECSQVGIPKDPPWLKKQQFFSQKSEMWEFPYFS